MLQEILLARKKRRANETLCSIISSAFDVITRMVY